MFEDLCHREVDGRTRFYCSHECMWLDESNPGRYVGDRNFFDRYHGWELSEIVRDLGFLRPDGKTLVAQPHLDDDFMWTLDDIRSPHFELLSPNIRWPRAGAGQRRLGTDGHTPTDAGPLGRRPGAPVSPRVLFEPIGEEIEVGEEETILAAAFRQGYNLAYGCREGQCSACKCFLLEGEVDLLPYSTFALSDTEAANGYTLICRALPYEDLVVELLHFDPENYRLENPIRDVRRRCAVGSSRRDRLGDALCRRVHLVARPVRRRARRGSQALVLDRQPTRGRPPRADRQALSGMDGSRGGSAPIVAGRVRLTGPYGTLRLRGQRGRS